MTLTRIGVGVWRFADYDINIIIRDDKFYILL